MSTARALAKYEEKALSLQHLMVVIGLDEEFQNDYKGAGQLANGLSYV